MDETYDVVVVGGGIAGLIAAAHTARGGARTLLLESALELGGRARTRSVGGFHFNQGAHALYRRGRFKASLDILGLRYTGGQPGITDYAMLWDGVMHPFPSGLGSLLKLTPLDARDRLQLAGLFGRLGKGDYPRTGTLREFTRSLRPRVRELVESLVRLAAYANAPERIAAGSALDQLRLSLGGVTYVDGGWGRLIEGLAQIVGDAGVEVRRACRVEGLAREGAVWRLNLAGAESLAAKAVVLAVEPQTAAKLLPASPAAALAQAVEPVRAVCLDLGLSRLPRPSTSLVLGGDEPLYLSFHSKSGDLAPTGSALVHTACYLAPGETATPAHLARLEALMEQVQPGCRAVEVERQRLTGIPVVYDLHEAGRSRAPVMVGGMPHLFLAGDWVGEGAMLSDAAAKSGEEAASAALRSLAGA